MNQKHRILSFALLSSLFALRQSQAQTQRPPLNGARVASEVVAGSLAIPVGMVLGLAMTGANSEKTTMLGMAVGGVIGPVVAVHAVAGPTKGELGATTLGTVAGYATVFVLGPVIDKIPWPAAVKSKLPALSFLLPSIGATIGYNSRRR